MSKNPARDDAALVASLAAEIKSERAYRSMTQEEVWTRAGISSATYKKIENGKAGASRSFTHIWAIAQALGTSANELIRRAEEREDLRRAIERKRQEPPDNSPGQAHPATGSD
jgi:transcriptional regulator with XRE-family HTH domain